MPAGISEDFARPDAAPKGIGFCGKLPTHGDFLCRRLPDAFARPWDAWLDAGIAASRTTLGAAWHKDYLASPIWRFVASAGCCGDRAAAGVLMPSVDRVGRHYPLTVVALLANGVSAISVALAASEWFGDIERLALSALLDDFRFDEFDAKLADRAPPDNAAPLAPLLGGSGGVRNAAPAADFDRALPGLIDGIIAARALRYSLWWAVDADERADFSCAYPGLPPAEEFHHLLRPTTGDG
ncbi:MAG TPA: type VI secretion system-associated protein TagF [Stellaceae bacterium]|nr:type VI secretion system-associated protein TagF [Stellaceae bacterium]